MKTFILCGGFGTRLDYEGTLKAKPMVRIGNKPILMHIVENFCNQGFREFVFCLGHKSESISNYFLKENKRFVKKIKTIKNNTRFVFKKGKINFKGNLNFTGLNTGTGGRILKSYKKLKLNEDFIMTYGDGLSNIKIKKLVKFHYKKRAEVTLTAVRPKQRYGVLKINNDKVKFFDNSKEKSDVYINGGFFVISKSAIKKIKGNDVYWEKEPLSYFLKKKKLFAYKHAGFWKSLDTLKDKNDFNEMIKKNKKPWKV
jgi:glucose-1-phosphate cytidylyltransferase